MGDPRGTVREGYRSERADRGGIEAEAVSAQLARILASRSFDATERNRRFLRYVVEETLAGRGDRIKAYNIGVAVFGRDDGFDPQSDPIVRIEASRLRRSLEHYYLLDGKDDPIRIEIPKGGYVPVFHRPRGDGMLPPPQPPTPSLPWRLSARRSRARALLLGLGLLGVIALGWLASSPAVWRSSADQPEPATEAPSEARPSLLVDRFVNLSSDPGDDYFAAGITQDILSNLVRFREFVVFDARTDASQPEALDLSRRLGADYVVTGTVRRDAERVRVTAQLVDVTTGASVWAGTYDEKLAVNSLFLIQDVIAANVAATIAQPYGVVFRDLSRKLQRRAPSSLSAYECLLKAYEYRRRLARHLHRPLQDCLEVAVAREPDYAEAWAMLALVLLDEDRYGYEPSASWDELLTRAQEAAVRAVELAPDSALALQAAFITAYYRHELDRFQAAGERALAVNPNNPEIRAIFGLRLALTGEWKRGLALVEEALTANPAPPGWYFFALSFDHYRHARYVEALGMAERVQMPGFFWNHVVLAMIYGQLGQLDEAGRALARAFELRPALAASPRQILGVEILDQDLLEMMLDGLRKAGLEIEQTKAVDRS